ncbi:ABC transporter ATP-binding protein [Campylobacter canadensis]|uniref:ATP-binding cassette domain-containing protein n=1 Tax=Campylobacter canadensis TaxID=449520 RepID=A0ABS7WT59_9BACT|nr:ATP-binding cassette domain-containing protein [Campylobacter canadensis]MBZ7987947.1 ATP-binding cassette domain-containing protein [Campylobacter canadensis]MBZ7995052.1 ATP-binding cassette domain-containing protein [Campylobacter canadensis]MBZ7996672.1 ATP-binding cassette domain-containing protein [Campylobacter canadensis]MBZ7998526.1 ATP-binding cassette domain-containing protein [Campylobacter canadensis]MBZ8000279.1 ATP-binding cassette domain-containing protein [Campylobacter can
MSYFEFKNLSFAYEKALFNNLSFSLEKSEKLCILGQSGSGKSTILKLIAGFEEIQEGEIFLDGINITKIPAHKRNIGFLFQDYALFPHLKAIENVTFAIKEANKKQIAMDILTSLEISNLANAYPKTLSGGQQQRLALARCIAQKPKLLLLDEPFCALDANLRSSIRTFVLDYLNKLNIACIMVTHDLADVKAFNSKLLKLD